MTDLLRDWRMPPFYWIDNTVLQTYGSRIGVYGIAVYNALAYHANRAGVCFPAAATIAKEIGCSERKVRAVLHELEDVGLINIKPDASDDGRQTANVYTLHHMQGHPAPHADEQESDEQEHPTGGAIAPHELLKSAKAELAASSNVSAVVVEYAVKLYGEEAEDYSRAGSVIKHWKTNGDSYRDAAGAVLQAVYETTHVKPPPADLWTYIQGMKKRPPDEETLSMSSIQDIV